MAATRVLGATRLVRTNANMAHLTGENLFQNDEQYVENALINYLLAKKMQYNYEARARDEATIGAQKKSYWKQCAFNAVSCFG